MDQVIISDLRARGIIGVNDWERKAKQEIVINLILYLDLYEAGIKDALSETVDYSELTKSVLSAVENSQRLTVEALANDLAVLCLDNPRVTRVRVRVEKQGAVRFTRFVGVEIDRNRENPTRKN